MIQVEATAGWTGAALLPCSAHAGGGPGGGRRFTAPAPEAAAGEGALVCAPVCAGDAAEATTPEMGTKALIPSTTREGGMAVPASRPGGRGRIELSEALVSLESVAYD
jgi:hypothetical protein